MSTASSKKRAPCVPGQLAKAGKGKRGGRHFCIQKSKLTVVSNNGKEAAGALLASSEF
jgi:hypothetical protein